MQTQNKIVRIGTDVFGEPSMHDKRERLLRFLEEALELVRAGGLEYCEVTHMATYEWTRPKETAIQKELGGAGVTLYALADIFGWDLDAVINAEINRVQENKNAIRAKSALKPDHVMSTRVQ